jgi:hydroxymethylbilane synthase
MPSLKSESRRTLRLGTRRSLLAMAQSGWVARELERLNPGWSVELVGIETRGDRVLDVPLSKIEGKEFFVAELDDALRGGKVDLTVHSMKDLSLDRPEGVTLACVPPRENPRDVLLVGPSGLRRLANPGLGPFRVGTSAPRRLENLPSFLSKSLPLRNPAGRPRLEFSEIRGNVNTRLARVHEPDGSERQLEAVVLAFAGLIRLQKDAEARKELERLLQGVRWMVLPLAECPTAPAQGALAVECRSDDAEVRAGLAKLHCVSTERAIRAERGILQAWGGGCHQRFGATQEATRELGDLLWVRGRRSGGEIVDELRWARPTPSPAGSKPWDGMIERGRNRGATALEAGELALTSGSAVFVAHWRALDASRDPQRLTASLAAEGVRVWVSGTSSWEKLAERGIWVEGSAENLGYAELKKGALSEEVVKLPRASAEWTILTHADADATWPEARVVATYRTDPEAALSAEARDRLTSATHVYWGSATQFEALHAHAPRSAVFSCGPGKTADRIRSAGHAPLVFPSVQEWRRWVGLAPETTGALS